MVDVKYVVITGEFNMRSLYLARALRGHLVVGLQGTTLDSSLWSEARNDDVIVIPSTRDDPERIRSLPRLEYTPESKGFLENLRQYKGIKH